MQWFSKGPTRLSEAVSFGITPQPRQECAWTVSKLDSLIDPTDVILNGSQYLHGKLFEIKTKIN